MQSRPGVPRLVGLATLVLLLSFAVPALGSGHAVRSAAPAPAATITVTATNQYGGAPGTFYVGLSQGRVAWAITDPSADASATVKINDQNAARDGLTNPVATYTALFHNGTFNDSYLWGISYLLPLGLSIGGTWNLTVSATNGGTSYTTFQVVTFGVSGQPFASAYLPGHTTRVSIDVTRTANAAPFAPGSLVVTGGYNNATGVPKMLFAKGGAILTPAGHTVFSFAVPINIQAPGSILLYVYANNSGENHSTIVIVTVGTLQTTLLVSNTPGGGATTFFTSGSPGYVTATEWISGFGGPITPVSNITVKFAFAGPHGDVAAVPGNPPLTVTSDSTGVARIAFNASSVSFLPLVVYAVYANASDPVSSVKALFQETNFSVLAPPQGGAGLLLTFGQAEYFAGDTATVNWQIGSSNSTPPTGWTLGTWFAYLTTTGAYYASGNASASGTSGSLSLPTPLRYAGGIEVILTAHNLTQEIAGFAGTTIIPPVLTVAPNEVYYTPGDKITVKLQTQGSAFGSASFWGSAVGSTGGVLWSGAVSSMSFSFSVPLVNAPGAITISASAQDSTGIIATGSAGVNELSTYTLLLGISTASSYSDGSFQPGQTISVHYAVEALGNVPLPQYLTLEAAFETGFFFGTQLQVLSETGSSGTFSIMVPSSAGTGDQILIGDALFTCGLSSCSTEGELVVPVNAHPAVLSYEPVAGSGISVAWLILLAVIVIGAVLYLLRRRGRRSSPTPLSPYTSSSPASGSSSTGGGASSSPASGSPAGAPPLPAPGGSGESGSR